MTGARVVGASYELHQQFRYEYPGPIERLRHRLVVAPPEAYGDQVRVDDEARYWLPSALTRPSLAMRDAAERLMAADDGCGKLAERINDFVAQHMRYVPDATTVETTAAKAFAQRTGVCQDFAHVMIALCRLCDIPARYVSGHLLGEGGTHAWLEVIEPAPGCRTAGTARS